MNWLERFRSQQTLTVDLIRIYLGLGLFVKGIFFLLHPEQISLTSDQRWLAASVQGLPYVHIAGGLLLASGLLARLACLIQIPILLGAIALVALPEMTGLQHREGAELTGLVLFLLTLFAVWGAGKFSLAGRFGRSSVDMARNYQKWLNDRSDLFVDLVRIYLGIGLFVKGLYIMAHRGELVSLVQESGTAWFIVVGAAHLVVPAHIVGGVLLALGLVTRAAALAQLPLLLGAVFWVYLPRFSSLALRENLELSSLVLFLLALIVAHGPGRFSVDHVLERGLREDQERAILPGPLNHSS